MKMSLIRDEVTDLHFSYDFPEETRKQRYSDIFSFQRPKCNKIFLKVAFSIIIVKQQPCNLAIILYCNGVISEADKFNRGFIEVTKIQQTWR